jgi:DNA repair protein RecN (Recombination protein N)
MPINIVPPTNTGSPNQPAAVWRAQAACLCRHPLPCSLCNKAAGNHHACNAGSTPRSLAKVASGGELARISLAISVITSKASFTPTLIFDEVDAGIGGAVAETVGKLLRQLGESHQILCVTHLPQVAAQGNHHLKVSKSQTGDKTLSQVAPLGRAERVEEVARMLGGATITDTTRRHARELLEQS